MQKLFRSIFTLLPVLTFSAAAATDGTSHTGGANGVDRKVYESYIRPLTDLPSFKKHLLPLFQNVGDESPDKKAFDPVFAMIKTWYFAPVDLKRIENEALGLTFIDSQSEQIGLQTFGEVWFDSRMTDPDSDSPETADAVLHEIVMSLYLTKFMSLNQLCLQMQSIANAPCQQNSPAVEVLMAPEPLRKLNAMDYENIRFVTNWIKTAAKTPIPRSRFIRVLRSRDFDHRYYNLNEAPESEPPKEIMVTRKRFVQLMNGLKLAGHLPERCTAIPTGVSKPCRITFEEALVQMGNSLANGVRIRINVEDEPEITFEHPFGDDEIAIRQQWDPERGFIFNLSIGDFRAKHEIGDRRYNGYLLLKMGEGGTFEDLEVDTFLFKPAIIVSADKQNPTICKARAPRAVTFSDHPIAVRDAGIKPTTFERIFPHISAYPACAKESVD